MDGDVIQAGLSVGLVALLAAMGLRPVTERMLGRWEGRFHVRVPGERRPEARRRLRRDRALRTTAVAVGLLLATTPAYMNLIDPARSSDVANPALGNAWLMLGALGALLAQTVVTHRRPPGPARASLVRREIGDYVPLQAVTATMVLAAVAVVAATAVSVSDRRGDVHNGGYWWFHALGAIVAVAAVGHGLRVVRDRPMLHADGPGRDLDEAERADGAFHLVGAGVALAAASASGALMPIVAGDPLALPVGLLTTFGLGWGWALVRSWPWNVAARRAVTS